MSYLLSEINYRVKNDPQGFVDESDKIYQDRIMHAADMIEDNLKNSPIVLLSGPSGSGKTTTAKKVEEELERRGVNSHTISMDNYFKTLNPATAPRTPEGDIDFESPKIMDMDLLNEHFAMLAAGEEIHVPHFMFARQKRSISEFDIMKLDKNEVAIFEGIHALSDDITEKNPDAFKLFISAASRVEEDGEIMFHRHWMRLARRIVRDNNFRGADAEMTLGMWGNVVRGEELYILPFAPKADLTLDSSLPYEVSLMKEFAVPLLKDVPEENPRYGDIMKMLNGFERFEKLDDVYIRPESLLREFIGGGIYKY